MGIFKLNPIRIFDECGIVKILECKKEFKEDVDKVEVSTLSDLLIHSYEVSQDLFIRLDIHLDAVKIKYYSKSSYLDFEILYFTDDYTEKVAAEVSNVATDYNFLKSTIQNRMDNPDGTSVENSKHTELLKNTTIDENAKKYVISKIKTELVKLQVKKEDIDNLAYKLYAELYGMGILQELDDDETVGEIMVNARTFPRFSCDIYYIQKQVKKKYEKTFRSLNEMENVFRKVIEFSKKELNSTENAMIEATRPNKDRVNIVIPDASDNWLLNIRKFSNFVPNLEMMKEGGTIDDFNDRLFKVLVKGFANIGIGGYMGTGKTTLINFLLTYTEPISRKVIIGSVSETDIDRVLKGHDIAILNVNDEKNFTFEKHLKFALRSTADRIIVPESRGEEFKQIYEANLKTSGNMFTAHALDDEAFMDMCVEMYKASPSAQAENSLYIKDKLSKSIDIIVIMRKVGNKIRIKSISEVIKENGKLKQLNKLQEWVIDENNPMNGKYVRTEYRLSKELKAKLNENGVSMREMEDL